MDCLCLNETSILLSTKAWGPVCNRQRLGRMSEKQYLLDIVKKKNYTHELTVSVVACTWSSQSTF